MPYLRGQQDMGPCPTVPVPQARVVANGTVELTNPSIAQDIFPREITFVRHLATVDSPSMAKITTWQNVTSHEVYPQQHNDVPATSVQQRDRVASNEARRVANGRRAQDSVAKWKCYLCSDTFTRGFNLRGTPCTMHYISVIWSLNWFHCHRCLAHLDAHFDRRPYICVPCDQGFTRRQDLGRHQRTKKHAECHNKTRGEQLRP